MVTGRQIRAARALLGWSQQHLADKAVVARNALNNFERGRVDTRSSIVAKIEQVLRKAGIDFTNDLGEGVRLRMAAVRRLDAAHQAARRRVSRAGR